MVFLAKINTTDAVTISFLETAMKHRKMAKLVTDAVTQYCRTPEGQKSLELITGLTAKKTGKAKTIHASDPFTSKDGQVENVEKPTAKKTVGQPRDLGGMLTFKKSVTAKKK